MECFYCSTLYFSDGPHGCRIEQECRACSQSPADVQLTWKSDPVDWAHLPQPVRFTVRAPHSLRDRIAIAALSAIIGRGDMDTQMDVMPYCQECLHNGRHCYDGGKEMKTRRLRRRPVGTSSRGEHCLFEDRIGLSINV